MKKLLGAYVALTLLLKAVSCGYLFITSATDLPVVLFAVSAALVVLGIAVALRQKTGRSIPNEMTLFCSVLALGTLFSLAYVNLEVLSDVGMFEMALTGNLFDVVVAFVAAFVFFKKTPAAKEGFVPQAKEAAMFKAQ